MSIQTITQKEKIIGVRNSEFHETFESPSKLSRGISALERAQKALAKILPVGEGSSPITELPEEIRRKRRPPRHTYTDLGSSVPSPVAFFKKYREKYSTYQSAPTFHQVLRENLESIPDPKKLTDADLELLEPHYEKAARKMFGTKLPKARKRGEYEIYSEGRLTNTVTSVAHANRVLGLSVPTIQKALNSDYILKRNLKIFPKGEAEKYLTYFDRAMAIYYKEPMKAQALCNLYLAEPDVVLTAAMIEAKLKRAEREDRELNKAIDSKLAEVLIATKVIRSINARSL